MPATDEVESVGDKVEGSRNEIDVAKAFFLDKEFGIGQLDVADAVQVGRRRGDRIEITQT